MKKRTLLYLILIMVIGALVIVGFLKNPIKHSSFKTEDLWVSKRPLPDTIAVNSYLTGNMARINKDLNKAVIAYADVLKKDPHYSTLLEDTYVLAMIQGKANVIMPFLNDFDDKKLLTDYAKLVSYFDNNQLDESLKITQNKPLSGADELLIPLTRAWVYAAQNNSEKALQEIERLKGVPFIKGYQKVLLGSYFKNEELIQQGINQIGDNTVSAIGYFPLLKEAITKTGNWEKSALYKKYQDLALSYPATADLLVQVGQKEITPIKGLAESFYVVSALGGNGHYTREESMIANSLALFLDPEKQISLIWGAELAEGLNLPTVSLAYYDRLAFHSATLDFKKANSLMLLDKTNEAINILEKLEKTNKTSIPLLTLLGEAYQKQGQREKAIEIYNRLIPQLENDSKNEPLIQAYLMRGLLYGHQENDKMLADLTHAYNLDPENAILLNDLGYHQLENNQIDEGFELVQKAYQKKPNDAYILDSMAFGYWKKGQASIALPLAEQAVDLMPQSALINAHLGDIYEALNRHREAGFQYKKALDLKTDLTEELIQEINQKLKNKEA